MTPINHDNTTANFSCGVVKESGLGTINSTGFHKEHRIFEVPSNLSCMQCVLQFIVYTDIGNFKQCTDIRIQPKPNVQNHCESACSSGGACVDGICECLSGYTGENCQYTSSQTSTDSVENYSDPIQVTFVIILVVLVVLGVLIGVFYWREEQEELKKAELHRLELEKNQNLEKIKQYEYGSYSRRAIYVREEEKEIEIRKLT